MGTDILPISLPNGQEISGRVIKHITGNGPIYLRALKALKVSHQMVSFSIFSIRCKQQGCILLPLELLPFHQFINVTFSLQPPPPASPGVVFTVIGNSKLYSAEV